MFDKHYLNPMFKIQQPFISLEYNKLVSLVGLLSINKSLEDDIKNRYPEIDVRQNNIALIFFALFIL